MSEFMKWFEAQHGKRPGTRVYGNMSNAELKAVRDEGERAADILRRRVEWDARKESALYAWQARERTALGKTVVKE